MYIPFRRHLLSCFLLWGMLPAWISLEAQVRCPELIEAEWVVVAGADCDHLTACLPVAYGDLVGYGVQLDGQPLGQALIALRFRLFLRDQLCQPSRRGTCGSLYPPELDRERGFLYSHFLHHN
ncbi:MAG: hypothetical protein IPL49_06125 [Saprospirales bacterium]|nr:hypothetical protein [Saprospirales bacterium]